MNASGNRIVRLCLALFVAMCAVTARAEIVGGDSVELLVANSDLIVRAELVELTDDGPDENHRWRQAVLQVNDTFKGPPEKRVTVRVSGAMPDLERWRASGTEKIVLLVRSDRYDPGFRKYPFALYEQWDPTDMWRGRSQGLLYGITSDLRLLKSREALEAAIRRAVTYTGPAHQSDLPSAGVLQGSAWVTRRSSDLAKPAPSLTIEMPVGSEAFQETWSGSAVFLNVPLDGRIEAIAHRWLDGFAEQHGSEADALGILRHFKTQQNIDLFKSHLDDRTIQVTGYGSVSTKWTYITRQSAYETLQAWGVDVPRPLIALPEDAYRPLPVTAGALGAGAALLVVTALISLLRARRAPKENRRIATRLPMAAFDSICLALLLAAALFLCAGMDRDSTLYECTGNAGSGRFWLFVQNGRLRIAHVEKWPERQPLSYARFDDLSRQRSARQGLLPVTVRRWSDFEHVSGPMTPYISTGSYGGPGPPTPYWSVRIPLWFIVPMLAMLPAARLFVLIRNARRRRRRLRANQCLACGYDLRGGHERCPECGGVVMARDSVTASGA
jgi:hypothetical protein